MVGELAYGRADLCAGGLGLDIGRTEVIDFSIPIIGSPFTLIIPNEDYKSTISEGAYLDYKSYFTVFSPYVWLMLITFALLFTTCIFLSFYCFKRSCDKVIKVFAQYGLAVMQKPLMDNIKLTHSQTFIYWLLSLYGMFIFIAYTCDMTAKMTTGAQKEYPDTFAKIADEKYKVYVSRGALPEAILKQAEKGTPENIVYENHVMLFDYPTDGNLEFINKEVLAESKQVYFGTTEEFIGDDRFKELVSFKDKVKKALHLGFQKDSDITDFFDFHLAKLIESGMVNKLVQKWHGQSKPKEDMSDRIFIEDAKPLGPKNLIFPSLCLVACMALSLVILIYERLKVKYKHTL